MSARLAPPEADRLRRAERRWLEHARERLRAPDRPARPTDTAAPARPEETDR